MQFITQKDGLDRVIKPASDKNINYNSLRRGILILQNRKVCLESYKVLPGNKFVFELTVESQYSYLEYEVNIKIINDKVTASCDCMYDYGGMCKHIVASLFFLNHKIKSGEIQFYADNSNFSIKIDRGLDEIIEYCAGGREKVSQYRKNLGNIELKTRKNGNIKLLVSEKSKKYKVEFNGTKHSQELYTSCNCKEESFSLCSHKIKALLYLYDKYGNDALQESFDWTKEKKEILGQFGYTLDDNYQELLDFSFFGFQLQYVRNNGLIPKDHIDIITASAYDRFLPINNNKTKVHQCIAIKINNTEIIPLIDLFFFTATKYKKNNKIRKVNNILENSTSFGSFFSNENTENKDLYFWFSSEMAPDAFFNKLNTKTSNLIKDNNKYSLDDNITLLLDNIPFLREIAYKYIPQVKELCERLANKETYYSTCEHIFTLFAKDLTQISISNQPVKAKLTVNQDESSFIITIDYYQEKKKVHPDFRMIEFPWIVYLNDTGGFAAWENPASFMLAILTVLQSPSANIYIPLNEKKRFTRFIQQFQNQIEINMKNIEIKEKDTITPKFCIKLSEMDDFLLFFPLAVYEKQEIVLNGEKDYYFEENNGISKIKRDTKKEKEVYEFISNLHTNFSPFNHQDFFFLGADDVMKNFWFLDFYQNCKKQGIEVYGFDKLEKIRYNPNKPTVNYSVKSEIDWFDVNMDVSFGDQKVSLKDIRKSVMKKDNVVKLSDGSIGILPEEWIQKWLTTLKFGKLEDENTIKLSGLHFILVEDLYSKLDDEKQRKEIIEKQKKLQDFNKIEKVQPPKDLKAELRSYQEDGLNWLNFLYNFGWGGCLADDMGLGKTLQVLALILYIKQKNKRKKNVNLVVAPTTLIFNWQQEIEKFCPSLTTYIHWGTTRNKDTKEWKKYDIILTSYGTLANDIDFIRKFKFNITVLDESQAIKNPSSLRFKAVCLLKSNLRLSLTGTPIENNTVELFAQMQYLNPGYLGTLNFFRKEFSNAIDKQKDKNQARQLSKMIRPFILRRKKEEVAKELPEKTENILYCNMEEHQKKVYEYFKDEVRNMLLSKIDEKGLDKARFNVLEGLLKLRQICDSPALLNTKEDYGKDSIKVDELKRHIKNKTGTHKILIFSQFLGMLKLIREELEKEGIPYAYLDGSTKDRKQQVQKFQDNDDCRAFLLSIKAGGFGLNLTKADYVYIMDPWWNPAVESQAIDRAHRIGQEKHVFAYKMVCKETIEEKILQLQEKKQQLASDIISTDKGFVSTLSKEDIKELLK